MAKVKLPKGTRRTAAGIVNTKAKAGRAAASERAREAMYDEIRRVYGDGTDGESLRAAAAARKVSTMREADLLGLTVKPATKAERRAARREVERKASLVRGGDMAERLARGAKATLRPRHVRAARDLEILFEQADGGDVIRAIDWRAERVDGGRGWREPLSLGGVCDAERVLASIRVVVGRYHFQVLWRFIRDGETLSAIAVDFERSDAAKRNGACSGETRAHVSRLLAEALDGAADVLSNDGIRVGLALARA